MFFFKQARNKAERHIHGPKVHPNRMEKEKKEVESGRPKRNVSFVATVCLKDKDAHETPQYELRP